MNAATRASRPCLQVRGVEHAYALKTVLHDINLTLEAGQLLALVGPSGCGKTTLLHLCAGLLPCQNGQIENGFTHPAMMFQQPRLLPWKTVHDNIALGLKASGVPRADTQRRTRAAAQAVGLDRLALAQFPHALSGGMQSRVAVARALVLEPDLLLLDEPFSALDVGLKQQMHQLLLQHQCARGSAVLMITHDLMEAVQLADTVLVMAPDPGRIVYRFSLPQPARLRSETDVYRMTAEFLQVPLVRHSFALAPLPSPSSSAAPAGSASGGVRERTA
jgi:NitT/TauT family transport system ATP-binding protein